MTSTKEAARLCSKCGQEYPASSFYGRNHWCRECKRVYAAKWRAENRESQLARVKAWNKANRDRSNAARRSRRRRYPDRAFAERIRDKYGITVSQYNEMLAVSGGVCFICEKQMEQPCIDHDHSTGLVRGLLCRACNNGLGNFVDDCNRLQRAIAYLQKHMEVHSDI